MAATANQTELVHTLLAQMSGGESALCAPVIDGLLELGYVPKKHKKSAFAVEFEKHGRIIAKMEISPEKGLIFWLRFSAGESYSQIFEDAVKRRPEAWVKRDQQWVSQDVSKCCGLCKGNPRFYHHINGEGVRIDRCGGYTLPVPGVTAADLPELLRLIGEQDDFFEKLCG